MVYRIAQVNIARLRAPLDSGQLAGFVAALDPVNASADSAPGFIWRLQTDEGNATAERAFEWEPQGAAGVIINMSVWESLEHLSDWVYGPFHRAVLVQRRQWFERVSEATTALWWTRDEDPPTTLDAESRVLHLRQHGPTPTAFTFKDTFSSPGS
jgi:heme-degrading monooxygenase HmoA